MRMPTRRLITKLARFENKRNEIHVAHDEGAYYDARFDGGEFSRSAHGRVADKEIELLAKRYGFATVEAVDQAAALYGMRREFWF